VREVSAPVATHRRYYPPGHRYAINGNGDGHLPRWISMAEALGWGMTERPGMSVTGGGTYTGGAELFGNGARKGIRRERDAGRWMVAAGITGEGTPRPDDAPAPTLSTKGTAYWLDDPELYDRGNTEERSIAERRAWAHERPAPTLVTTRRSKDGMLVGRQLPPGEGQHVGGWDWKDGAPPVHDDMPDSTRELRSGDWPQKRPATTVAGDPCVFPPGGHHVPGAQSHGAIRVTAEEAAVLQTFRPDYPFQGTRTKQFQQIGNAVPPKLAEALLGAVLGIEPRGRAARAGRCGGRLTYGC
jgi:DNA (cytosine-5)-methyltransferase 1